MESEYPCRLMHEQALEVLAVEEMRQVGERATRTDDYRCRCCRRSRLFILGDSFVECACHQGARWWGLHLYEQTL
jgi:hypothetical protein